MCQIGMTKADRIFENVEAACTGMGQEEWRILDRM